MTELHELAFLGMLVARDEFRGVAQGSHGLDQERGNGCGQRMHERPKTITDSYDAKRFYLE
jgi:hypothetical protein